MESHIQLTKKPIKMKQFKMFLFSLCFVLSGMAFGQEVTAKKYDNPHWVSVGMIKFKPMGKSKAMKIVEDYFAKADEAAGIKPPTIYHLVGGDYDMMVVWEMTEGLEAMNYETSPEDVKWLGEMAKLTGGQEQTMAKLEEFYGYVDNFKSTLARKE
ncbi:MAG: hypothetical protein CME35_02480 [Gramella sp.]|nr:hypothetical protein [Christiangramia sp.]